MRSQISSLQEFEAQILFVQKNYGSYVGREGCENFKKLVQQRVRPQGLQWQDQYEIKRTVQYIGSYISLYGYVNNNIYTSESVLKNVLHQQLRQYNLLLISTGYDSLTVSFIGRPQMQNDRAQYLQSQDNVNLQSLTESRNRINQLERIPYDQQQSITTPSISQSHFESIAILNPHHINAVDPRLSISSVITSHQQEEDNENDNDDFAFQSQSQLLENQFVQNQQQNNQIKTLNTQLENANKEIQSLKIQLDKKEKLTDTLLQQITSNQQQQQMMTELFNQRIQVQKQEFEVLLKQKQIEIEEFQKQNTEILQKNQELENRLSESQDNLAQTKILKEQVSVQQIDFDQKIQANKEKYETELKNKEEQIEELQASNEEILKKNQELKQTISNFTDKQSQERETLQIRDENQNNVILTQLHNKIQDKPDEELSPTSSQISTQHNTDYSNIDSPYREQNFEQSQN